MALRNLVIVCCVLLFADSILSQSPGAGADPISGHWGSDGATFLELQFDGTRAVSGTTIWRGGGQAQRAAIRTGTFDPPTGALKLEGEGKGRDGAMARYVIEGKLDKDALAGTFTFGNEHGAFRFTKVAAAQTGDNDAAAALRKSFGDVSGWVTKAADLVPADRFAYRPAPTVRTFGQLIGHIADGYNYYCGRAAGRNVEWSDAIEKGSTDRATLARKLKESTDACHAAYGGAGRVGELIDNVGHTNLHYGNIITYMRMLGLTPPSS